MPCDQGVKGEAVVSYCEPLATPKMGYHRFPCGLKKIDIKIAKFISHCWWRYSNEAELSKYPLI
jgi:hypothetical protein